ncbi:uncharacterized protein EDB93DRAFT_1073826 [Suillus bovinus]|uniref:uncharacterized protein n=1 Tax=Suillus bovinus TaxID=48563 RepID=UPI001B871ADC|nr:uncharacterized protein EDB93DRAFT_1073826 [Suillus bovinus]KAG2160068.1 hypothetical protein EDB93DRAFT_1073826 [Suillus bovinus]
MSAQSIARWNAIPMSRPDTDTQEQAQFVQNQTNSMKRSHQDVDDDDDDGVSLVSRSPSPTPDVMDIEKYDEYVRGPEREVITIETKIKSTNKGFAMLAKLGWSEGQPLGLSADGTFNHSSRVDPIPFHVKNDLTGLGKTTQDFRMIETTVAERRKLDSERQRKETGYQRKAREASPNDDAARRAALKSEISDTLKPFYCALCEKQFQNVAQYDEHTNSYAHHHKARLRDMQANTRMTTQEDVDKRKEKERKREEKELRKIAKAAGIKMAKPTATPAIVPPALASAAAEASLPSEAQSSNLKKVGWATVSAPVEPVTGFKRSGWASLDSNASSAPLAPLPPPPVASPPPTSFSAATPTFRTGGWTSLDVGSSQSVRPPPPDNTAAPPPPPPYVTPPHPPVTPMNAFPLGGRPPTPPAIVRPPSVPLPPCMPPPSGPPPLPPTTGGWGPTAPVSDSKRRDQSSAFAPTFSQPAPPAVAAPPTSTSLKVAVPPPAVPQTRSGWQQWKQNSGSKRR